MLALGYSVLSRLAYVLYIGLALRRADAQPVSRDAAAPAYARFRRRAALLMYHDGIAFVAVCLLTRGTLDLPVPPAWRFVGAGLVALGVAVKLWATATLGADGYYWRDFFEPPETRPGPTIAGPYRSLRYPMYTMGYLQPYGLALRVSSLPRPLAPGFSQRAVGPFQR